MRKLVLFMHLSLDGYAADLNHGLTFLSYDGELMRYAGELMKTVGTPVYGRTTYELMAGYWPAELSNPDADEHSVAHARWLENVPKVVVSTTMKEASWNNTRLIGSDVEEAFRDLKQESGGDLVIFGSPRLSSSLLKLGLIDEYKLTIHPVILGSGLSMFQGNDSFHKLKLVTSSVLSSGVITAHYTNA